MIVLNESKPKYEILDGMFAPLVSNVKFSNEITFIIDLKDVLRKFFIPTSVVSAGLKDAALEISADVINTVAHFRNYFMKTYGMRSKIYVLYSETECKNILFDNPFYKKDYYESRFHDPENKEKINIVRKAASVVSKVLNNVPNTLYIDTSEFDELVYIKSIIQATSKDQLVILQTNDQILYQVISDNVFVLTIAGVKSVLLKSENIFDNILKDNTSKLSSKMIPLVYSIAGYKRYNIPNIPKFGLLRAVVNVENLVESGRIVDCETINIPIDKDDLDEENKFDSKLLDDYDMFYNNYYLLTQNKTYLENAILLSNRIKITRTHTSADVFLDLNAKIFVEHPLNITMLLRGEKLC